MAENSFSTENRAVKNVLPAFWENLGNKFPFWGGKQLRHFLILEISFHFGAPKATSTFPYLGNKFPFWGAKQLRHFLLRPTEIVPI